MDTADAIDVRPAKTHDVFAVLEVDHVAGRAHEVRRAIEDAQCLVSEIGGKVVGFCVGGRFFAFDYLELLASETAHPVREWGPG